METTKRASQQVDGPLVIIPGGATQAKEPSPPVDLYRGSYHLACRRAALALTTSARVLVLSPRYGLVPLDDRVHLAPYEDRVPRRNYLCDPGGHQRRARHYAVANGLLEESPIVLAGRAYWRVCLSVWPDRVVRPLARTRTVGEQLALLHAIETTADLPGFPLAS